MMKPTKSGQRRNIDRIATRAPTVRKPVDKKRNTLPVSGKDPIKMDAYERRRLEARQKKDQP